MEDSVLIYILQNLAREDDKQYADEHLILDSLVHSASKNVGKYV